MKTQNLPKIINFKLDGRECVVGNFKILKNIFQKMRGLMFRSRKFITPLLFVFDKPGKYTIHSFFCRRFIAVWMLDDEVIDVKIVSPFKFCVTPEKKFNLLLEVPLQKA
jgi:uncharacterized membrane protein (UPF0127 family)